jgi:protein SMG8
MVFLVSHVIVVVHPTLNLDLSYLQLFKNLDSMRLKAKETVSSALEEIPGLPRSWISAGRPCSPRVLFYFEAFSSYSMNPEEHNSRKQELLLEDQLYRFLRRNRIITNICGNSLFAVCNQMDYVFIEWSDTVVRDGDEMLEQMLTQFCSKSKKDVSSSSFDGTPRRDSHSFYNFLWSHLHVARTKGFDDNVGRHNDIPTFDKPTISVFFNVLKQLRDVLFEGASAESVMDSKLLEDNLRNLIMSDEEDDEGDQASQNFADQEAAISNEKAEADNSDDVDSGHRDLRYDPFEQDYYDYRR